MDSLGNIRANRWICEGNALKGQHRYEEAVEAYDRALELDRYLSSVWYNKGCVLDEIHQYGEAVEAYCRATLKKERERERKIEKEINKTK